MSQGMWVSLLMLLWAGQGWTDTRAIGAEECTPNSQPWQAGLFFLTRLFCGATLLNDQWLLTAAHCRKPYLWVRLGEHHLWKWEGPEQLFRVTDFFPHPGFNSDLSAHDHNHDIMLIRLKRPAKLGPAVQPLNISNNCVRPGTTCLISGWGATSSPEVEYPLSLQCANISVLDPRLCHKAYPGRITSNMVCAGLWEGGRGSCQGDSGGPLVCNGALAGVVSGGAEPCSKPKRPSVYTSVCQYRKWISKTMRENST
ncbi:LOW QUALITY PROTEIN: kallikrein-9 [Monodelphis domestica]|uniref:LOW QUALITY PROTEIN: kallikrein-9 n=1 Tax=Monodelphis domestica TaxID=13616 RepID=UPI0004431CC5|nr:LOW QUALITY PROTEIN: kallikrein-9 [Monodelphis domestica]